MRADPKNRSQDEAKTAEQLTAKPLDVEPYDDTIFNRGSAKIAGPI